MLIPHITPDFIRYRIGSLCLGNGNHNILGFFASSLYKITIESTLQVLVDYSHPLIDTYVRGRRRHTQCWMAVNSTRILFHRSPPLAKMYCPVTQRARGETNINTASAISSGYPGRSSRSSVWVNLLPPSFRNSPSGNQEAASVMTPPGATVLTLMPLDFPNCFARCSVW